jgi:hypothetical protein
MTEGTNNHSGNSLGDEASVEKVIVSGYKLLGSLNYEREKSTRSDSRIFFKTTVRNDMSARLRV